MKINIPDTIKINDLALASYLALKFPIIEIKASDATKYDFVFENETDLQEYINSYYKNTAIVSPRDYFNSIKNLKGRLYSGR